MSDDGEVPLRFMLGAAIVSAVLVQVEDVMGLFRGWMMFVGLILLRGKR